MATTPGSPDPLGEIPLKTSGLRASARSADSSVASVLCLKFQAPSTPLSINKANRMHWAAKKRELDLWRNCAAYAWLEARKEWPKVKGKPCTVQVTLPFRTRQRRDPHNYTGTVIKALVDSLVMQGVWPDDNADWVTVLDPICVIGSEVEIALAVR